MLLDNGEDGLEFVGSYIESVINANWEFCVEGLGDLEPDNIELHGQFPARSGGTGSDAMATPSHA